MKLSFLALALFSPVLAFAQDAAPVAVAATPAALNALQTMNSHLPGSLTGWILGVVVFLVEMLMRFIPSAKPRSILILVSTGLKVLASIFEKLSGLADQIVQNLKDEAPVQK
jgi:hypothetical protein